MRDIQVLDKETIDKIAAGEVVDRPASVIKELTENAIDAQATAVTIEIRDGGTTFMRITDNGAGIEAEQVRTAFLRHATSKIRKAEDLVQIASLGFRGEALSSISAVSQVECITKTPEALTGIKYVIEGGAEKEFEEIGAPTGTTFIIRNLFFNTPARAKFLKSAMTEGNHVAAYVEELALSHPEISFKYIQNGQTKLYTSGNGNLREIIYQIYGRDITKELISIDHTSDLLTIRGFIGNPNVSRGNRNFENYFINGRYVKSKVIAKAIEDAYHGFLMQHKYPFTLLYLDIDGEKVDVNVHPQKMEVRISDQEAIYHELCLAIQNALMNRERIPEVPFSRQEKRNEHPERLKTIRDSKPEPFEQRRRELNLSGAQSAGHQEADTVYRRREELYRDTKTPLYQPSEPLMPEGIAEEPSYTKASHESSQKSSQQSSYENLSAENSINDKKVYPQVSDAAINHPETSRTLKQLHLFEEDKVLSEQARKSFRMIGQIFATYWMIEYQNSLYIIDQHAAHEKVNYERMMKNYREKKINAQMLYPSIVVNLSAREVQLMERNKQVFEDLGFELEEFGGNAYKINAVPDNLYSVASEQLFMDILNQLDALGEVSPDMIPERLASMSCKAAIKGNQEISVQEANALIDELLTLENPYNCPHGRPTIISMSRYELDKKFKRIV